MLFLDIETVPLHAKFESMTEVEQKLWSHKAKNLKPRPKDVLFIVDSSRSISNSQLQQFKDGINSGLKSLDQKDRFNIIGFTTKRKPLFKN